MSFIALIVFTGSGLYLLMKPKPASAAWFDDNWSYRTSLIVTNNAADSNKKVKFDIDTAALISAGKMQSDCGDSRFTDVNGNVLRYFIDTAGGDCNTNSTDYYILIPSIINGTTVIYHYYGNTTASNGTESANFTEDTLTPSGGSAAGSEEKSPGPVAYWKFDDGQGTTAQDSTTNNLDGTLNNTPTWQTEDMCIAGKCLYFDGTNNENVSKSDDSKLDFAASDNFTIGAWVKRNGASSANNFILTKAQTGYTGYKLYQDASGDYCFDVSDGTNTDTACTSAVEFDDNNWHLVQGVKSGTTSITLYVDGKQRAQDTTIAATGTLANTGTFYIGVDLDGTSNEWLGFIDEVKVYPYARSAAQILADFNSRANNEGSSALLGGGRLDSSQAGGLSNGLVGYWKMNDAGIDAEGETIADSSGNSNSGTLYGDNSTGDNGTGLDCTASGKFGTGCSFDGTDDYVTIADPSSGALDFSGDFTISTWFNFTSVANSAAILGKNFMGNGPGWGFRIQSADSLYPNFWVADNVTSPNAEITYSQVISNSTWYHLVGVRKNGTTYIYLDGSVSSSTGAISGDTSNSGALVLGARGSGTTANANVKLDEVRIYNRALSPNEVSQLYNFAPSPVGYWKLDEKTGQTTYDSSGNGNNGTLGANGSAGSDDPTWVSAKMGAGLSFDGGDYVGLGDPSSGILDFGTGDFTIETWLKFPLAGSSVWNGIITKGYTVSAPATTWGLNSGSPATALVYHDAKALGGWNASYSFSASSNGWHHIAITRTSGTSYKFYKDGVLDGTQTSPETANLANASNLLLGNNGNNRYLNSSMDEVKLYNYARTQKQIVSDMGGDAPSVIGGGARQSGPVGYWKFNEGVDNTCSGGSNDACNSGSVGSTLDGAGSNFASPATSTSGWTQSGKFGKALIFDGSNDVVTVTNADPIDMDKGLINFTFSAWIYPTGAGEGNAGQIYQKGTNTYLRVDNPSGSNLDIEANLDLATTDANVNVSAPITTNAWNHIAAAWDGTTLTVYINGRNRGTGTGSGAISSDANNLLIGGTTTANFAGTIDDFKVYGYALTANEILTEFNRGSAQVMGALSDNSSYQVNAANQEYCVPGDSTSCAAPVGRWDFNEKTGQTVYDTSGNALHLTLGASASSASDDPTWTTGKVGGSLNFDGTNDYAFITDNALLRPSTFTLSLWLKKNSEPDNWDRIIEKQVDTAGWVFMFDNLATKKAYLGIENTAGADNNTNGSNTALPVGVWRHYAYVFNGTSIVSYEDGAPLFPSPFSGSYNPSTNNLAFGATAGPVSFSPVTIDHVKFYNYARTPAQVAWDYNKGAPAAHWKFDECQGSTANDSSGNSYTGTITIGGGGETTLGDCLTASTAWGTGATGKRNSSLSLDGTDDYVSVTDTANLRFNWAATQDFSLFAWVKRTTTGTEYILSKEDADNDGWRMLFTSSNTVQCSQNATDVTSTSTITDTNWHLIGCTMDRDGNGQIYIDGKADGSAVALGSANMSTTSNITLGTRPYSSTSYLNGQIDDVRIYNYALTATQVKTLYNNGAVNFGPVTGSP